MKYRWDHGEMPELAEGARLEIVCSERDRGFESLSLRHEPHKISFELGAGSSETSI
jgi:hypothetical protein